MIWLVLSTRLWSSRNDYGGKYNFEGPVLSTRLWSSVNDYVGNQHGGKYNFDEGPDAQAQAGADYSAAAFEVRRTSESMESLLDAAVGDAPVLDGDVVRLENPEMCWVGFKAKIVGDDAFDVSPSEGSLPPRGFLDLRVTKKREGRATDENERREWRLC